MFNIINSIRKNNYKNLLKILYKSIIFKLNIDVPARINYYISKEYCHNPKCKHKSFDGFFLQLNSLQISSILLHNIMYHDADIPIIWYSELLKYQDELQSYKKLLDNIK